MSKKALNLIIVVSIISILLIVSNQYFLKDQEDKQDALPTPTSSLPTKTPTVDPEVLCQSRYFNFEKGTIWRYRVSSEIEVRQAFVGEKKIEETKQTETAFATSEIIEASSSSFVVETKIDGSDKKRTNKITCRESGIYGFFYLLAPPDLLENINLKKSPLSSLIKFERSFLFLPSKEKLRVGESWQSEVGFNLNLPVSVPFGFEIENVVVEETHEQILDLEEKSILTVGSDVSFDQSSLKGLLQNQAVELPPSQPTIIRSRLAEDVGLLDLEIEVDLQDLISIKSDLVLVDFKTP